MTDGNGGFAGGFPEQMSEALRAARSGRHVSVELLRGAVCAYIDEMRAAGVGGDDIRQRVFSAFAEVNSETPLDMGAVWSNELVDELIKWCRERQLQA